MKARVAKPLVLCEGKQDKLVMEALAVHAGIHDKLEFRSYDGEAKLRQYLRTLKAEHSYTRGEISKILVTRDADSDYAAAWQSLKDSVKDVFGVSLPQANLWESQEGYNPPIAGWIVPGDGRTGMIETLYLDAAKAANAEVFECVDAFVGCLERLKGARPHEKARFAVWTIAAGKPEAKDRIPFERAISELAIDWDATAFQPLRAVLEQTAS